MENADGRVILFILIAFVLFVAGRRFQHMVSMWKAWRGTVAAVPVRKKIAFGAVKTMIKVGIIVAFIFWLVTNINRFM